MKRAIVLVLDGCGAGAAPDHADYGDGAGVNTLKNVWDAAGGFAAPHLGKLGFLAAAGIPVPADPSAVYGRLRPVGKGKDSVTGHWEMAGAPVHEAFPTYPHGFPDHLVKAFESEVGRSILGNKPASGTKILEELGAEHMATGSPILYTSADSVFQIAAHEDVIPVEELYRMCEIGRRLCQPPDGVQRVIARPFVGAPGAFSRTERRKDFPLPPPANLVDEFAEKFGPVLGIGVIPELFDGRGFQVRRRTQSNPEHFAALQSAMDEATPWIFANFEDFDMKYGHRSDPAGFARCLEEFDGYLAQILARLGEHDLLILTADHGNDPTDASTDHTREYVPFTLTGPGLVAGNRGDVDGLMAIGATVAEWVGVSGAAGRSLVSNPSI